jgi:hypothetical protein
MFGFNVRRLYKNTLILAARAAAATATAERSRPNPGR